MPDSLARSLFPKILRFFMSRDGFTQVDIAERLHVSKQTVSEWVNGKKFPRVDRMQQLADLFHVKMSEMYTSKEDNFFSQVEKSEENNSLSSDENLLLAGYRTLTDPGKEYMLTQLTAAKALFGEKCDAVSDVG